MRWKEASTVIIAAKNKTNEQFQILSLQRSEKSRFLPNVHVFPGGVCDEADASIEWLKAYKFNIQNYVNLEKIEFNMTNPLSHHGTIYKPHYNNYIENCNYITINELKQNYINNHNKYIKLKDKVLPKFISLRITAIRETFEESGILLCKPNTSENQQQSSYNSSTSISATKEDNQNIEVINHQTEQHEEEDHHDSHYMKNYFNFEDLSIWRKKVYNNPLEFINMCVLFDCHPDLNNVKIWSNWLSPGSPYFNTRYDSKFFLVMFNDDEIPKCDIDYYEMKSLQWCSPEQLIKDSMEGKIWLPPPQLYECSRLVNFKNLSQLNTFLASFKTHHCEQWLPVRVKAKDGEVTLLPGDWMYPTNGVDLNSIDYYKDCSELTMTELQNSDGGSTTHNDISKLPIHRSQHSGPFSTDLVVKNIISSSHSVPLSQYKSYYKCNTQTTSSKL